MPTGLVFSLLDWTVLSEFRDRTFGLSDCGRAFRRSARGAPDGGHEAEVDRPIRFAGIGGDRMIAEGLESLFPLHELSLMGIAELLPRLPNLIRRLKQTAEEIRRRQPDVVVTIDAPDFCFRIAKRLKGSGIPFVHYVAPTVWAWRPGRARKIAAFLDHLLALLPFEPPYFEREGLPCTFVGHSIVEGGCRFG